MIDGKRTVHVYIISYLFLSVNTLHEKTSVISYRGIFAIFYNLLLNGVKKCLRKWCDGTFSRYSRTTIVA